MNGRVRRRRADDGQETMGKVTIGVVAVAGIAVGAAFWTTRSDGQDPGGLRADPADAAQVARGKAVYIEHCASCHGANLEGQPDWRRKGPDGKLPAPPHDASGHTWHHPDDQLFLVTKRGTRAIAGPDYKTDMREFGSLLSDDDIWAVLAYIKSRWPAEIRARHKRMNEMRRATEIPKVTPPQK
jgi:mono/diheme cytochrome c family protein